MQLNIKVRYQRGENTRARILNAAISLFGSMGFDSITTREIAEAAAVPPASLRYYFENKQGLYIACLSHVHALVFSQMESEIKEAELLLEDGCAKADSLIDSFCDLQEVLIDAMVAGPDGGTVALFVLRHDLPSEGGSGSLSGDEGNINRAMVCFTEIIMRISDGNLDRQLAARIAGLINGQVLNLYVRRNRLESDGWDITPERLQWIKEVVRKQSRAMLMTHRPCS